MKLLKFWKRTTQENLSDRRSAPSLMDARFQIPDSQRYQTLFNNGPFFSMLGHRAVYYWCCRTACTTQNKCRGAAAGSYPVSFFHWALYQFPSWTQTMCRHTERKMVPTMAQEVSAVVAVVAAVAPVAASASAIAAAAAAQIHIYVETWIWTTMRSWTVI